jgi:DNA-binding response OmpR family regulator
MCLHTTPRRFSVLVVDDNRDAADTLAVFLRLNGHDVRVAYGGEEVVAISKDWRPDAAILDIVMQGVDGIELAARLRKVATWPLLLLAVTGVGTNDEVARVKAGVFDHFFLKPVDPEEVLRALDTHKIE